MLARVGQRVDDGGDARASALESAHATGSARAGRSSALPMEVVPRCRKRLAFALAAAALVGG